MESRMFAQLILAVAAALGQPASAPAAQPAEPPVPVTEEMRRWLETFPRPARMRSGSIGFEDYPASAIRAGAQGAVVFRYVIGTDGRVVSCEVVQSSGNAALDASTCAIAQRRFSFLPAFDGDRNPVTEVRTDTVRWRLSGDFGPPEDAPPRPSFHWSPPLGPGVFDRALERHLASAVPGPAKRYFGYVMNDDYPIAAMRAGAQGVVEIRYTIGADGRVRDCRIVSSSGNAALDERSCTLVTTRFLFLPAIGPDGRAIAETKTQRIAGRLPSGGPTPPAAPPQQGAPSPQGPPPPAAPPPPKPRA
jgi:protein TonB